MSNVCYDTIEKIWYAPPVENCYSDDISLGEIIYGKMSQHRKNIAQISISEDTVLTKEELQQNSIRVAIYLRNFGITQDDIVGIIARNTTHLAAVAYACLFNGTAFHALNPSYDKETIEKLFSITKPKIIFCDGEDFKKVRDGTVDLSSTIITMKDHIEGIISILDILKTPIDENFRPSKLDHGINQTSAILCSSGTTGVPKAVTLSNNLHLHARYLTSSDVQYTHSTLDWITCYSVLITTGIYGSKRIITDKEFDPKTFLDMVVKYKVTWIVQPPRLLTQVINSGYLTPHKLDSVRCYSYGGGKCSEKLQRELAKNIRNGKPVYAYSITEFAVVIAANYNVICKPNSVGRLLPGVRLKILNSDTEPLGPNQPGEICVYHGKQWNGYYGNVEETKKMQDKDGWFRTGDIGYMDEDNDLFIVDRKKDNLKYMGIGYYPNDIENIITEMPEVAEVCVFGIADETVGDAAAATVVKKNDCKLIAQDVIDYVARSTPAKYKHLNGGVLLVDDLEKSVNGKIMRAANKAKFLQANKLIS